MIEPDHARLSIVKQCGLLGIARSTYYYEAMGESALNLDLMRRIDEQYMRAPSFGSRLMMKWLRRQGIIVTRKRIRRLMRLMGLEAIYQKPRTSKPDLKHRVYPYLLRDLTIDHPNQVWCTDITYIPMQQGFMYLTAVMDWYSRKVLSWRLSNTMESDFCVEALQEAMDKYGCPEIFNTDQGSQFTSLEFTGVLQSAGVSISMDGKGRWMDNVFIERLWRTVKYECVYLHDFSTGSQARKILGSWFSSYNEERPHSSLDDRTPNEAYGHDHALSRGLAGRAT